MDDLARMKRRSQRMPTVLRVSSSELAIRIHFDKAWYTIKVTHDVWLNREQSPQTIREIDDYHGAEMFSSANPKMKDA